MTISPDVIIPVLAALLTGGFLMLTIENIHLSASVSDRYYSVMKPFFHKLTKYVEFIKMVRYHFRFQKTDNEYAQNFKRIIDDIANLKGQSDIGLDISVSTFTAKELDDFCEKIIGNVWYFASEKWNLIKDDVEFDNRHIDDITLEYLSEVTEKYKNSDINVELIANVSDDFDRNIYGPIQKVPSQYEEWKELEKGFRSLCIGSVYVNLFSILVTALFNQIVSSWILCVIVVINILLFIFVFSSYTDIDKKSRTIIRV